MPIREMRTDPAYAAYSIGRGTYGTPDLPWPKSNLTIGSFCSISTGVRIFMGGNHNHQFISQYPFDAYLDFEQDKSEWESKGDVVIGNDVWIGECVTIMSGVKIGDGAVIGAHSVVASSIPPYAIATGNPARVRKYRFHPSVVLYLLRLRWWDWSDEKIQRNARILASPLTVDSLSILEKEVTS